MFLFPLLREMVHSPALEIILRLKQSTGLSVNELCQEMKMSYMGVKQHCVELEKHRMVDTWRRPKATGRPEKIYRLTEKLGPLFPEMGNGWTLELLESAEQVLGERAAEKVLFAFFQRRAERWQRVVKGEKLEVRLKELAKQRLIEGFLTVTRVGETGLEMVDHHDPFGAVGQRFPLVRELDREGIEKALGVPVTQKVEEAGALRRVIHSVQHEASTF
jgi:predicted ArsR family transcriptional regulator